MKKALILIGFAFIFSACTSMPINKQEYSFSGRTSQQVKQAILQGCADRGWVCNPNSTQSIEGTLNYKGTYMVKVDMPYSSQGYEIIYKDSKNLNEGKDRIDKSYYKWTAYLNKSIQKALAEQGWTE